MFGNMLEGYYWCFCNIFYITVSYKDLSKLSIFSSVKAEIECEMYGRNATILTAFFCSVVIRLCLNPQRFKPYIR